MKSIGYAVIAIAMLMAPRAKAAACVEVPGSYINIDGKLVHRPACPHPGQRVQPTAGGTARCRDGSESFSLHHAGTCSHHGGVAQWE